MEKTKKQKAQDELRRIRREAAKHVVKPNLTITESGGGLTQEMVDNFRQRIEWMRLLPPGAPEEFRQAFEQLKREKLAFSDPDKCTPEHYGLWTQHLFYFDFVYFQEWLDSFLWSSIHSRLLPSPETFKNNTQDSDLIETARKVREFVERHADDVDKCVVRARGKFLQVLSSKLGSLVLEVCDEIAVTTVNELLNELHNDSEVVPSELRSLEIKHWEEVMKERLQSPTQGRPKKVEDPEEQAQRKIELEERVLCALRIHGTNVKDWVIAEEAGFTGDKPESKARNMRRQLESVGLSYSELTERTKNLD